MERSLSFNCNRQLYITNIDRSATIRLKIEIVYMKHSMYNYIEYKKYSKGVNFRIAFHQKCRFFD